MIDEALDWVEDVAGHNPKGTCLFGDITDLVPNGTYRDHATYSEKLWGLHGCTLASRCHCLRHGRVCESNPKADFDCSGLPCTDASTAGLKRKRAGSTNSVCLTHGRYVTQNKTPLILLECTPAPGISIVP